MPTSAEQESGVRVILLGGSSCIGKSTLAVHMAQRLGWDAASTDKLARHPGRPWAPPGYEVPSHVAEHYLTLDEDALIASVSAHYRNTVWPLAEATVRERLHAPGRTGLVLEGSALWPRDVVTLGSAHVAAAWLVAPAALMLERIRAESRYADADARHRRLADAFLGRALRYDAMVREAAAALQLPLVEVEADRPLDELADEVLASARALG